jgi:hypothetical protein
LPDDSETLKAMLLAERVLTSDCVRSSREMQRHRFGRRAETLTEDQMLLGLEDVELNVASDAAKEAAEADGLSPADRQVRAHKRFPTAAHCQHICRVSRPSISGTRSACSATIRMRIPRQSG